MNGNVIALLVVLNACAPAYIPNMVNTPLFSNKNEFTANVGGGSSGIDAQVAYAMTDHVAVMANSSFSSQSNHNSSEYYEDNVHHKHRFFEGGIGYFDTPTSWLNFEAFGGYGKGTIESYDSFWGDSISGDYYRVFVQPSMGIVSDYLDLCFTPRFAYVGFDGTLNNSSSTIRGTGIFIEPVFTIKLGFKQVKFFSQIGWSIKVNSVDYNFENQPSIFSFGTQLTLGRKREKSFID